MYCTQYRKVDTNSMIDKNQLATELRQEADRLTKAAELLSPATTQQTAAQPSNAAATPINNGRKTGRRKMSKEARARMSAAQQARWAKKHGQPATAVAA
jgi:hypothetical protein